MENKQSSEKTEITFLELLGYIGSGIKKGCQCLLNALLKSIRFIYKNAVLIFSIAIIFIAIGIALYFIMPKKHIATGSLHVYGSPASLLKEILSKDKQSLSEDSIAKINSYYFVDVKKDGIPDYVYFEHDKKIVSDTSVELMTDRLFLEIDVLDIESPNMIQEKILDRLNNNPLLVKNFNFYRQSLQEDLDFCTKEISRIDSLSNKTYFEEKYNDIQLSNGVLALGRTSTQLFYEDLFKLQEKKAELLNKIQELEMPANFPAGISFDQQSERGVKFYALVFAIIGFCAGIIVALFYRNRKRISTYMNS
ncbi:hypothetical protein LJC16_02680 [Bacteroidales bacterium OttesenSCG-928-C19]|nr:hypothetical protein [Bacteroidales bacterium OttesenSCG-928-C19]